MGQLIHDPTRPPEEHDTAESYLKHTSTSVNHFYEKLLLLKDRMNTATGRALAQRRHQFMQDYLRQLLDEWDAM